MDLSSLLPRADILLAAVALDAIVGDPVYSLHPVRLMGRSLVWFETRLRAIGSSGRVGGCLLFAVLAVSWVGGSAALLMSLASAHPLAASAFHLFAVYSLVAIRDLFKHCNAVDTAVEAGSVPEARAALAKLVGRDTDRINGDGCRRAAIESLAENLVDSFISPILWYAVAGLPGLVLFKVVSTMDSMVGYKTERYILFGWCGARLDDHLNLVPARLAWLLIAFGALLVPGCSAAAACRVAWRQHSIVPGPNAGWSEAAMAGALQRRLIGPIWAEGKPVTETWLGRPEDAPAGSAMDFRRAAWLTGIASSASVVIAGGCVVLATGQ